MGESWAAYWTPRPGGAAWLAVGDTCPGRWATPAVPLAGVFEKEGGEEGVCQARPCSGTTERLFTYSLSLRRLAFPSEARGERERERGNIRITFGLPPLPSSPLNTQTLAKNWKIFPVIKRHAGQVFSSVQSCLAILDKAWKHHHRLLLALSCWKAASRKRLLQINLKPSTVFSLYMLFYFLHENESWHYTEFIWNGSICATWIYYVIFQNLHWLDNQNSRYL